MCSSTWAGPRAMLGCLALLWALLVPGQEIRLVQLPVIVSRVGNSVTMPCRINTSVSYIHWYRQLEGQAPERLLYLATSQRDVQWDSVLQGNKVTAKKGNDDKSCTLSLMKLEKGDEGLYYCAAWDSHSPACSLGPSTKSTGAH